MFKPYFVSASYSASLPGSDASARRDVHAPDLDRQRPRPGSDLERRRGVGGGLRARPGPCPTALPRERHARLRARAPSRGGFRRRPARRRRFRRRADSRRPRKRLVRVERWIQHGHRIPECRGSWAPAAPGEPSRFPQSPPCPLHRRRLRCRSTIRFDGALRQCHPAPDRSRGRRHRPIRPGADAAVEPRRPCRPPVPRVPELPLPVHRRQDRAGRPHGARRGRRRRAVHPPPGRVRPRLDPRAGHAPGRPGRETRGKIVASAGSACSSIRRRASSTRGSMGTSRSSCRTSRTCRSRSIPR